MAERPQSAFSQMARRVKCRRCVCIARASIAPDTALGLAITLRTARLRDYVTRGRTISRPQICAKSHFCFILRSLKHKAEVQRLRALYRDQFILIGVYSPRSQRTTRLAERLAHAEGKQAESARAHAEELIATDEDEKGTKFGQGVRDAFPLADAFVSDGSLESDINRIFDLLFGAPFVTPTPDEQGMYFAASAALRSAALARQVGACITNQDGDILAIGCNEVPRAGGGQYWAGQIPDGRDFVFGHDRNDRVKQRVVTELVSELKASNWITKEAAQLDVSELVERLMSKDGAEGSVPIPRLRQTRIGNLTEFGRDVHGEMSAITTLARLGISAQNKVLYCTTFPCHNCAKHILSAGIIRVIYIEPFPKSFAAEFHDEAIVVEGDACDMKCNHRVVFQPFSGVSPRKYMAWFTARVRKDDDGRPVEWSMRKARPVFVAPDLGGYWQADLATETKLIEDLVDSTEIRVDSPPENSND